MENIINIKETPTSLKEEGILSLITRTVRALCFDIPFTLIEKIPNQFIKLVCYNTWTLMPSLLFGAPFLFYKCYHQKESLESLFLNALLPPAYPPEKPHSSDIKYKVRRKGNYNFYKLESNSTAKTIIFLPGRHGSFENNKSDLYDLFSKRECNIITWDAREDGDEITFDYIESGAIAFLEYLNEEASLDSDNVIFYAYSLGGLYLSMILKMDKDKRTPRFQNSYFVVERSFRSLQEALKEAAKKCCLVKWALNHCDKSKFGPDLFKTYPIDVIPSATATGILHLAAEGDFTISRQFHSQRSESPINKEIMDTTILFGKPDVYEIGAAITLTALNLFFLNGYLLAASVFFSTMYLVSKSPCYFNTHAMPYAFSTEEVCDKMKLVKRE